MSSKTDQSGTPPRPTELDPLPRTYDSTERTRKVVVRRRALDRKVVVLTLRVVAGRDMLRFVTLEEDDELVIGRDETVGLVLSDASVSRRHAMVECDDQGNVMVRDLGSTNGTAINGNPIDRASQLRPGDNLEVGGVSLRLDLLTLEEVAHLEGVLVRLEQNNRDPLTGLLNRAWLDDDLAAVLQAAARHGTAVACLFVDIDRFKTINDRFGHQLGDDVLVGVARLLMLGVRETDACIRYGGEEMLLVLQGTDEAAAYDVAERVRASIQDHDWSRTEPSLRVTASIGVAQLNTRESMKEWIHRADRALYAAKAAGRNRSVRASTLR